MSQAWLPAEHGTDNRDLRQRVQRGLIWTIADSWGRQLLGLAVFIVIARLVSEVDIGLVALAAVFVAFAQIFVDQGLSDALVQRRQLSRGHIDTAFWISMGVGLALALAGVVLAIPIALLLREPALQPILQVLSLSFVLTALSSVQIGLLRRELAFRSLALRTLLATAGGGVVGIALAYLGYGAWALVGQQLAQGVLSVAMLWRVSPWRPGRHVSAAHFRQLFGYSRNVVGTDILGFFSRNSDNFLIGAVIGIGPLGLYAVGFRILEASSALLIGLARRIAFPALSRLQHDPARMKRAFFRLSRISGVLFIPAFVGLALVAPELVVVLFGRRWEEAGPVAALLFLAGPVIGLQNFSSALLNASGHPGVVFRFRLISAVASVVAFTLAVLIFSSITAVAAAFLGRAYLLLPLSLYWVERYAGLPAREYVGQFRGIAMATLAMAIVVIVLRLLLDPVLGPFLMLGLGALSGFMVFVLTLGLVERRLLLELLELARQVLPGGPRPRRRRKGARAGSATAAREDELSVQIGQLDD